MSKLKFYFDESVELAVSEQLARIGFDVVSAHSLDLLGNDDLAHLQHATKLGRVLCSYDADFLQLAETYLDHAGIVFTARKKASIGGWIRELRALHARMSAEEIAGQVLIISMRR